MHGYTTLENLSRGEEVLSGAAPNSGATLRPSDRRPTLSSAGLPRSE